MMGLPQSIGVCCPEAGRARSFRTCHPRTRIIVVVIGVVRPGLFTKITCILIEFFWVLIGQVGGRILRPLFLGFEVAGVIPVPVRSFYI